MNDKTKSTKASEIERSWHLVDLRDQILGRSATQIASLLIGKGKPYYVPHLDCGDYVVAINAAKVRVSGKKYNQKRYYRHSGYPGGFRTITFAQLMEKDPTRVVGLAVRGMLPKNKLRDQRLFRLKVFPDDQHPYADKLKRT